MDCSNALMYYYSMKLNKRQINNRIISVSNRNKSLAYKMRFAIKGTKITSLEQLDNIIYDLKTNPTSESIINVSQNKVTKDTSHNLTKREKLLTSDFFNKSDGHTLKTQQNPNMKTSLKNSVWKFGTRHCTCSTYPHSRGCTYKY